MTTAHEIELLISRLGVLLWQLDDSQTVDSYEQQLTKTIWEPLNHVSTDLSVPSEAHRSLAHLSHHVCPIL